MPEKKHLHALGFLGTGVVARTFLARLDGLRDLLGPVYSPTKRATPRLVTAMGAGYPVAKMEDVAKCRALLVCAPLRETEQLLEAALGEGVLDRVDTLALVEQSGEYLPSRQIAGRVRETGFLSKMPIRKEPTYLVEGSLRFRRFCQVITGAPLRRLVLTRRDARAMVESAVFMAEEFCLPLFEAVQKCISLAGVPTEHARQLTAELMAESVGNASFAGRKRWNGILHSENTVKLSRIVEALQQDNELMANLVLNYAQHGLAAMGKDTDWIPKSPHAPLEATSKPDEE